MNPSSQPFPSQRPVSRSCASDTAETLAIARAEVKYPATLKDSLKEMYFWHQFPPDLKPDTARVRLSRTHYRLCGVDSVLIDNERKVQLSHEETLKVKPEDSRYTKLLDLDVDQQRVSLPAKKLDFKRDYAAYRNRLFPGNSQYGQLIDRLSDTVIARVKELGVIPSAFVAIPSRKEIKTSRAFSVIRDDFLSSGETPLILILHNDISDPSWETMSDLAKVRADPRGVGPQPDTLKDLAKIRADRYGLVFDLAFSAAGTIGDARAILADVIMETNSRLGTTRPMVLSDADTIAVRAKNTYRNILALMNSDPNIDVVSVWGEFDQENIKNDATFAFRHRIIDLVEHVTEKFIPLARREDRGLTGALDVINILRLPVLGGFPRTNVMEDVVLGEKIKLYRGRRAFGSLPSELAAIAMSGDRHAHDFRHARPELMRSGGDRYADWEISANRERPVVEQYPLDKAVAIEFLNSWVSYLSHGGRSQLERVAGRHTYGTFREEIVRQFGTICAEYGFPVGENTGCVNIAAL